MLLGQSDIPVHMITCSEYAAIVFKRDVLRSMSRSGGVEAQAHVGEGQVGVVEMEVWKRAVVVEKVRRGAIRLVVCIHGAGARKRRANVKDMVCSLTDVRGKPGKLYRVSEWVPQQ
jgi:hypothetical protein